MITCNWRLLVVEYIQLKVKDVWCLRQIALMLSLYKNNYEDTQDKLNYYIINRILFKKSW